ncbi:MAG TPA: LCP family protein [Streptomyces sp.]|nr:LCP family protein [Streptomyces sp.]
MVLGLTGYGWAAMKGLVDGLTTSDVIGEEGGGEKPADGARDVLLVGLDSRTDAQGNPLPKEVLEQLRASAADEPLNTDTLLLMRIPNDGSKAVTFSVPRDSYVDIPDGYGKHKINSAYVRAKNESIREFQGQGVSDPKDLELRSNQEGAKKLIETMEQLTGVTIDNYAAVNLLGFYDITQAVGGVDVCLKNKVKDKFSGADFEAGPQTISGADALAFVRQRHGIDGDLDRVVSQQVFMAGLAKKILSAGTLADPGKLQALIDATKKSVVLNQGWDIIGFAQQMKGLTGGQLEFHTIPVGRYIETENDGDAIEVDPKQVSEFVRGSAGLPAPPPAPGDENAGTTVDVRNASGVTGLAAEVTRTLTDKGFTAGDTANAESRKHTVIRHAPGAQDAGRKVSDALGAVGTVEEDASIAAGRVTVLLGSDYSGPDSGRSSAVEPNAQGGSSPAGARQQQPPPAPPITAEGVPCVN